jgi:nucleoside-diphosphate-sugar epimerase
VTPPPSWLRPSIDAVQSEEAQVLEATRTGSIEGIVLRFGGFYGPGAGLEHMIRLLRRRAFPIPRRPSSRGLPWIHINDAASAMVAAIHRGRAGHCYNIADDEPTPVAQLIAHLASVIGAPKPMSIPNWVVRLAAPFVSSAWFGTTLKVSNEKAKQELGWSPQYATYRQGLANAVASSGSPSNAS